MHAPRHCEELYDFTRHCEALYDFTRHCEDLATKQSTESNLCLGDCIIARLHCRLVLFYEV